MSPFELALGPTRAGYIGALLKLLKGIPPKEINKGIEELGKLDARMVMIDPLKARGRVVATWGEARAKYVGLLQSLIEVQKQLEELEKLGGYEV